MRRTSPITALLIVLLVAASVFLLVQNRRNAQSLVALRLTEQATREHYGQAISEIAAIQDSLNAISISGGVGSMRSGPLSAERRLSPTHGDEVLARVAELRAGIERARDRIRQLEVGFRESGVRVAGLLHMVAQLKDGVAAKEQMVAELSSRVDSLQTHVSGLTAAVEESQTHIAVQDSTLEDRRRELGTVYCLVGTRQDLLKRGAVVVRGGLLGLGRTLDPSGKVDEAACMVVDTDAQTVISIPSPRARVLTPQPPGSYTLEPVNGQLELRILDAREFRKVRHLVIVTA